jgi:hypothetical protein
MRTMNNIKKIRKMPQSAPEPICKARAVLRELIEHCCDPARLLELYYWSAEEDLVDTLRRYIELPEQPREALRAFLIMVADCPESVVVSVSQNGDLTLSSPTVAQLMSTIDGSRTTTDQTKPSH